jgi:hypothetical protein
MVVSELMTGETAIILEVRSGSRGCSFGPRNVYNKCRSQNSKMIAALAAMNAEGLMIALSKAATALGEDYLILRILD